MVQPRKTDAHKVNKVRYVARLVYKRTSRVIGLNVVYLMMFNRHNTKHVFTRERGRKREREREGEGALVIVRGAYPNPRAPESHCYVMYMCTKRA